ncbi:Adenylate cyclase [Wickerhamomyces ciferrii]|uniref:Adenylate cyclase n=1 Tax=Wickerhamomyces ciferrii (strain ATCC 14091 / BCRC 22168 / CBS 111 / JCM 3599 / NBRC 0793 / NRRL Y-1031 F-60-10) TaxID=1206466 RepID=K0K8K6_WICCF|nr:Adenylate cyclase [Wickerhamomyces ciferrii]CCH41170.1 Adenylate cyclase [Wickerhamomyces ciferrii]
MFKTEYIVMDFTELPTEIHSLIFKQLYPSDFLNIIENILEWRHLITSDNFKIVTNDVPKLQLKYGLADDYYLDYNCNFDEEKAYDLDYDYEKDIEDYEKNEKNNTVLNENLLLGFKGAILIEIYVTWTCMLKKFDENLLLHDPIELIWHGSGVNSSVFTHMFEKSGDRLKKIHVLVGTQNESFGKLCKRGEKTKEIEDAKKSEDAKDTETQGTGCNIQNDDDNNDDTDEHDDDDEEDDDDDEKDGSSISEFPIKLPSTMLHIPGVKSLNLNKLEGYSIPYIQTIMPDLDRINICFDGKLYYDSELDEGPYEPDTILGCLENWREKSKLGEFFETSMGKPIDFLKTFQLKYFHNKKFKFEKLQLSNLEKLVIDSSTIHSIQNLNLPNLKTLKVEKSAIYQISNLKLNSLQELSIDLKTPHYSLEKEQKKQVHFTIQNIKSQSLRNFNLVSSFKIKKISKLDFPSLQTLAIKSTNDSNQSFETITNSSFPQLENVIIENIPLDNLYPLFQNTLNLKSMNITSCPVFNLIEIGSQNSLKSLILKHVKSIQGFTGISLPTLQTMELQTTGETPLTMENCSFENLKSLRIDTHFIFVATYDSTLSFLNNDIPQLQKLFISGYEITNHFTTTPYPALESLTIDRIESIEISPSETLNTLDLSENFTTLNLTKSDELPNLKEYKEASIMDKLRKHFKKAKVDFNQDAQYDLLKYMITKESDLVMIWHEVPELRHIITPDTLQIVTNHIPYEDDDIYTPLPEYLQKAADKLHKYRNRKYKLPEDFYIPYKCELYETVDSDDDFDEFRQRLTDALNPIFLKYFEGSLLVEIYHNGWDSELKYIDKCILKHDPVEVFIDTPMLTKKFHEHMLKQGGDRLKRVTFNDLDPPLNSLPPPNTPPNLFRTTGIKDIYLSEFNGYTFSEMYDFAPDLKSLHIKFKDKHVHGDECEWGYRRENCYVRTKFGLIENELPHENSVLTRFFSTEVGINPSGCMQNLKFLKLKHFHNKNYKFGNFDLPNLEQLKIESCTLNSIQNMDLPKLVGFKIERVALFEISNLKLNSLQSFFPRVSSPHLSMEERQKSTFKLTLQNIESHKLRELVIRCSFKIEKLSNLTFPLLKSFTLAPPLEEKSPFAYDNHEEKSPFVYHHREEFGEALKGCEYLYEMTLVNCMEILRPQTNFPNVTNLSITNQQEPDISSEERAINATFPKLHELRLVKVSLHRNFKNLLEESPKLEELELTTCSGIDVKTLNTHPGLKNLRIKDPIHLYPWQNISLPNLEVLNIVAYSGDDLVIENCSFESLTHVEVKSNDDMAYDGKLTFVGNNIPILDTVTLHGYKIEHQISTEPYPKLKKIAANRIMHSLKVVSSELLRTIDLTRNFEDINVELSDNLPGLKFFKKPTLTQAQAQKRRKGGYRRRQKTV